MSSLDISSPCANDNINERYGANWRLEGTRDLDKV